MSQLWVLGWPLTELWAEKYLRHVLGQPVPIDPETNEPDILSAIVGVCWNITGRLMPGGHRIEFCWYKGRDEHTRLCALRIVGR